MQLSTCLDSEVGAHLRRATSTLSDRTKSCKADWDDSSQHWDVLTMSHRWTLTAASLRKTMPSELRKGSRIRDRKTEERSSGGVRRRGRRPSKRRMRPEAMEVGMRRLTHIFVGRRTSVCPGRLCPTLEMQRLLPIFIRRRASVSPGCPRRCARPTVGADRHGRQPRPMLAILCGKVHRPAVREPFRSWCTGRDNEAQGILESLTRAD